MMMNWERPKKDSKLQQSPTPSPNVRQQQQRRPATAVENEKLAESPQFVLNKIISKIKKK